MHASIIPLKTAAVSLVLAIAITALIKNVRGQSNASARQNQSEELNQLLKVRYDTALNLLNLEQLKLTQGATTLARVCDVARWVRDSAVELPLSSPDRLTALTNFVSLARQLEQGVANAAETGAASRTDQLSAHYIRLDAEVILARASLVNH